MRDLTSHDELALDTLGDKPTALFIIIPDTNATFNFLVAMLYTQLFDSLCFKADDIYGGRRQCLCAASLTSSPTSAAYPILISSSPRSAAAKFPPASFYNRSASSKQCTKKSWETIVDNCDSFLFLGGKGDETTKMVSNQLGKETIDHRSLNKSRGRETTNSEQNSILGRELLTDAELRLLKTDQCILSIRTCPPFLSKKYPLEKHPNYKKSADHDKSLTYDISVEKTDKQDTPLDPALIEQITEFILPEPEEE